jgi:hypothetical protein
MDAEIVDEFIVDFEREWQLWSPFPSRGRMDAMVGVLNIERVRVETIVRLTRQIGMLPKAREDVERVRRHAVIVARNGRVGN